jgi:hypothetical protein
MTETLGIAAAGSPAGAAQPAGWMGYVRRVDADMLAEVGPTPAERP